MTLEQARELFGLGPNEDPRPYLAELRQARERIAALVRSATDESIADRYQEGLMEFDRALAILCEFFDAPGPELEPPSAENLEEPAGLALPVDTVVSEAVELEAPAEEVPVPRRRSRAGWWWLSVVLVLAAGAAGIAYYQNEQNKFLERQGRITGLEREGAILVENRRWQEAARCFDEIEALAPGSELARLGHHSIEEGMNEERTQFIGYWKGQAIAELESVRLDPALAAIQRVLEKFPDDKEALTILERIRAARASQTRAAAISAARKQFDERQWNAAIEACRRILADKPDDADAQAILADASAALEKLRADQARAKELLDKAIARDQGQFDAEALGWLREAVALAPGNKEISARLEKMASYTRTLRVPGDFATPAEALAAARERDRIVLADQTWQGPLLVNAAIELQGGGPDKTVVECAATEGSPITIGPDAKGVRISGISFRHASFHAEGSERFPAALVRGGSAVLVDCHFRDASGHGLVVTAQGTASASRCRFSDNGWNGAAAIGQGSVLELRDSEALNNFEHGIETWDGATATLVNNRCEANCRNGIHVDNGAAPATLAGNQLIANREFGLVLGSAGTGKIAGNTARANLLGGMVIRAAAAALPVTGNQITQNHGPGLVLEKGLAVASYADNTVTKNTTQQIFENANLSEQEVPKEAPVQKTGP
jgi:tetratricopeptide (TPR) repeat protein